MINISTRELYELKCIVDDLEQGGELAIVDDAGGHELSRIQTSLIVDIIGEYIRNEDIIRHN